jgi:putative transposase
VKYTFIKDQSNTYSVVTLCRAMEVSPSGFYDWLSRPTSKRAQANQALLSEIREIYKQSYRRYGSPRIYAELVDRGTLTSLGRVERLMCQHGIAAERARRHRRTYIHREPQIPELNHLNREFDARHPNEKWVSDITFIPTRQGWLYLAIVLDLYSRAIVGWSMSSRINGQLVHDALDMAIAQREPAEGLLVHSDQGSQYTALSYRQKLVEHGMRCSMSRKGECHDNAVAESFFHTLKEELVYDADYRTRSEARQAIFKYIELFYNRQRRHSTIGYKAPMEYEKLARVA